MPDSSGIPGATSRDVGAAGSGRPTTHDIATRMLAFSKARLQAFQAYDIVINDIAWELLLGLFVAQERGQRIGIYQLCSDIPVHRRVSIRWLRALRASGLVEYDDLDGSTAQARLTRSADSALRHLIER